MQARAAEMLFRPQKIARARGRRGDGGGRRRRSSCYATTGGFGSLGELLQQNRTPLRTVDLDVLDDGNAEAYWDRDERHDLAVSLNRGRPALDALCRVLERWVAHFTRRRRDDPAAARDRRPALGLARRPRRRGVSALLNDLYNRADVDDERMGRLLCLFELDFAEPGRHAAGDRRPARLPRDGDGRATGG